jgi:hypothetical protein
MQSQAKRYTFYSGLIGCTEIFYLIVISLNRNEEFRCRNNECIPRSARCDNKIDCQDSSDEELCLA